MRANTCARTRARAHAQIHTQPASLRRRDGWAQSASRKNVSSGRRGRQCSRPLNSLLSTSQLASGLLG
eukprot:6210508-Pleurochrysis_carterae.AAC.1